MIIIYNTLSILLHSDKYSVFPSFPWWIFYASPCLSLPPFPPLPGGLKGMSRVGKDVSSRDVRIEWQAISVGGKATHYTDCFAAFLASQGQCHLSSVGPLHERSSRNGIHSLVWHYSSARSSVRMCISLRKYTLQDQKLLVLFFFVVC